MTGLSLCTHITIDHRNLTTWQISWRATGGGRGQCMSVSLRPHNDEPSSLLSLLHMKSVLLIHLCQLQSIRRTINARADTRSSWLCDERWPCACIDDISLNGTGVNAFTFAVRNTTGAVHAWKRERTLIEKPGCTCLRVRRGTVCSWGQIEAKSNRNDTVLTRTRAVGYRVPPQRLPLKGGRSRWKQTRGIHQSSSPFPSSSSRFRCMAVRLWHANKRLFLFSSPLQEKVESKMRSRASNGLVTMENRSLLISFFHSLGFSFSVPSFGWCREVAVRGFEGRDEGEEWWVLCPCQRQLMAHLRLCGWSRVKRDAFWSVTERLHAADFGFILALYLENLTK